MAYIAGRVVELVSPRNGSGAWGGPVVVAALAAGPLVARFARKMALCPITFQVTPSSMRCAYRLLAPGPSMMPPVSRIWSAPSINRTGKSAAHQAACRA